MDIHKNARSCPASRALLVRRILERGWSLRSAAEMKVLAFIVDFATAKAIRKSLELPAQKPEPLAHGPPRELEFLNQTA